MFWNVFGPVQMRSDAFRGVGMRSDTSGYFRCFLICFTILMISDRFLISGAYFYLRFTCRGLTFSGANYWEVALRDHVIPASKAAFQKAPLKGNMVRPDLA